MRRLGSALGLALLAYAGLCAALYFGQRALIYFPQPRTAVAGTEAITLDAAGALLQVTALRRPGAAAVLYFGGNAEDAAQAVPDLAAAFPGLAIRALHYRGYGGSTGEPTEAALVADAVALFDSAAADGQPVIAVGRSLGSGVAVQLAARRPVAALVLVTPYDSLLRVAQRQYPFVPVGWLLRDRFESWRYAADVKAPVTLIAAGHDEVIPRAHADALRGHFRPDQVRFVVIAGAGHNDISERPEYLDALRGSASRLAATAAGAAPQ